MFCTVHDIAIAEAKYATGLRTDIHIDYHLDRAKDDFPVFAATMNDDDRIPDNRLIQHLKRSLRIYGYFFDLDGIGHYDWGQHYISFLVHPLPAKRITPQMRPLPSKLQGNKWCLAHPPSRPVPYHPNRVATLMPFIDNWRHDQRRRYIPADPFEATATEVMFQAGYLQKSNEDIHRYRPTVAGIQWYAKATAYLDSLPKQFSFSHIASA